MTLKTRTAWIKLHDSLEKQLATTQVELQKVSRGDLNDVEDKTPSVLSLREDSHRPIIVAACGETASHKSISGV